jgi:hypothetical protein
MTGKAAPIETANFGFLAKHDVQLMRLGALAERYFGDDPNTTLIKLRQFAELNEWTRLGWFRLNGVQQ